MQSIHVFCFKHIVNSKTFLRLMLIFLLGGLSLDDTCVEDEQCTGTANTYCQNNVSPKRSSCRCIRGYVEINSTCFKGIESLTTVI